MGREQKGSAENEARAKKKKQGKWGESEKKAREMGRERNICVLLLLNNNPEDTQFFHEFTGTITHS